LLQHQSRCVIRSFGVEALTNNDIADIKIDRDKEHSKKSSMFLTIFEK